MRTHAPSVLLEIAHIIETREPSVSVWVIMNRKGKKKITLIPGKNRWILNRK